MKGTLHTGPLGDRIKVLAERNVARWSCRESHTIVSTVFPRCDHHICCDSDG